MGTRRKSRELCLQMLFQSDLGKQTPEQVRRTFWTERAGVDEETRGFADDLFGVATERRAEIDDLIEKTHNIGGWKEWRPWTATCCVPASRSFLDTRALSKPIIINEALEIARKFSSPESVQFINGVLDSIGKELSLATNKRE